MGGSFTDALDTEYKFIALDGIEFMNFWNNELQNPENKDSFPVPAVFFEFNSAENETQNLKTATTNKLATTKDATQFTLHCIGGKYRSEARDEDYLDLIDLADTIYRRINGKNFANCKNIHRIDEYQDIDSAVLMDWTMIFECYLSNIGETELEDANAPVGTVTPEIQSINFDPNPYL